MNRHALFNRSELLIGEKAQQSLADTRVILFGVGGVGGWCAEALIRSGLGHLTIVDSDAVCVTNSNRQVQATTQTLGLLKVEALALRLRSINPEAEIVPLAQAFTLDTQDGFAIRDYDYVLDAIDSLSPKMGLILHALESGVRFYSSFGASSKIDPTRIRIGTLWTSHGCPLGKRIRKRLRHHGIKADFPVVYSDEMRDNLGTGPSSCGSPQCYCPKLVTLNDGTTSEAHEWCSKKAYINGSLVQVTGSFGFFLASLVINDVLAHVGPLPLERGHRQKPSDPSEP